MDVISLEPRLPDLLSHVLLTRRDDESLKAMRTIFLSNIRHSSLRYPCYLCAMSIQFPGPRAAGDDVETPSAGQPGLSFGVAARAASVAGGRLSVGRFVAESSFKSGAQSCKLWVVV